MFLFFILIVWLLQIVIYKKIILVFSLGPVKVLKYKKKKTIRCFSTLKQILGLFFFCKSEVIHNKIVRISH